MKITLVFAPLMITGFALGLPYKPKGVAFGYSAVMILWVVPHVLWCVYGTPISFAGIFTAFVGTLFIGVGQQLLYLDLLRGLTSPPAPPDPTLAGP